MSEKKVNTTGIELGIFFLIAYGVNFLFGILLIFHQYMDSSIFSGFIVMLPAMGALLAKQYKKEDIKENKNIRNVMSGVSLFYLVMILLRIIGLFDDKMTLYITQMATMIGSIMLVRRARDTKKERRLFEHFESVKQIIYLWIILLVVSNLISSMELLKNTLIVTVVYVLVVPLIFWSSAVYYFGEEYGWRGYLQEKMQHRFGKRVGVILLGVIWELWHMPLWFTAYDLQIWEIPLRFAVAISMSIFLGYIFMRTKNVWICALVHCIYNIMVVTIPVVAAATAAPVAQFWTVFQAGSAKTTAIDVVAEVVVIIVMASFIFTKEYKKNVNVSEQ